MFLRSFLDGGPLLSPELAGTASERLRVSAALAV